MKIKISVTDDDGNSYEGICELGKIQGSKKKGHESKTEIIVENESIDIKIPEEMIENITDLDERTQFPIIWYFSTIPILTVSEFLNACADKGLSLSPSWHTSAGGNFKNRLVKEDKMFTSIKTKNHEKKWKLTDVGKLKIKKLLNELQKKSKTR